MGSGNHTSPKLLTTLLPTLTFPIMNINSYGPRHKRNLMMLLTPPKPLLGLMPKKLVKIATPQLKRKLQHAKRFLNLLPPLKRTYLPSKPPLLPSRRKSRPRKLLLLPLLPRRTTLNLLPNPSITPRLTQPTPPNPPPRKL